LRLAAPIAALLMGLGCTPGPNILLVQVVSDLTPIVEFDHIRVEAPSGGPPVMVEARVDAAYGRPVRVLSTPTIDTSALVRVTFLLQGREVASATRRWQLAGTTTIVTVRVDRDCIGVTCTDALAGACLGGMCVRDDCTPETPQNCPPGSCGPRGGGRACPASTVACVDTSCSPEGVCVGDPRSERCGPGQVCDSVRGCIAALVPNAGMSDASVTDASATDAALMRPTPVARVVQSAYFSDWFGPVFGTPGMSRSGYAIDTTGVSDGELLVIVACVDNGSDTVWPDPLAPGFTRITQDNWGTDHQSCAIAWRIAHQEPATYAGTYGPGIVSGSSVIALLGITGIDAAHPVTASLTTIGTGGPVNPVPTSSAGVTTTTPNSLVLYVDSADWDCFNVSTVSYTLPTGFRSLFEMSDQGTASPKDWTTFQIAMSSQAVPGPTGTIANVQTSTTTCNAIPWNVAIAISP